MKTFSKAVVIGGLVAGGLAVATMLPAMASPDEYGACHRGGHSGMMGHHRDGEDRFLEHMTRRLDLSAEQQATIRETLKKSEAQRRALAEKLQTGREALRKLTEEGHTDDRQLQPLAQEQGKLLAEQIVQRAQVRAEIHKVLTDTQRAQLKEMRDRHGRHFRG